MASERAARREERWARRYERAQAGAAQQWEALANDPLSRRAPALAIINASDGRRYRLRLVAPGEPLRNEGVFNLFSTAVSMSTHGSYTPTSSNGCWVVTLERQRGPWRGYDKVQWAPFMALADAERHLQAIRDALERGEEIPPAP